MFIIRSLMMFIFSAAFVLVAQADPIEDLSFNPYNAGWFPNFYNGNGPMDCRTTCKVWTGVQQEHEMSSDLDQETRFTSVCKVTRDKDIILKPIDDPTSHWLYGNQFDERPACIFSDSIGQTRRSEYFMCLCVEPGECQKPDLVVSFIHDPVWDNGAGVSIIDVDITNIGSVNAAASFARLTDPGTGAWDVAATPALAPGVTVTITFTLPYWVFDPDAELEVEADYKNDVDECREDNNRARYFKIG